MKITVVMRKLDIFSALFNKYSVKFQKTQTKTVLN